MLGQIYYKGIAGITSMQDMTDKFNNQKIVDNIATFIGADLDEYLPHYVTENEYLERLNPDELQKVIQDMVYQMIRRKSFDDARFMKKWLIIIDGTQLYSGNRQINEKCLERHYNKGTEQEKINYHNDVLEAKIYFGSNLVCSICSEFIENNGEDAQRQRGMSEAERKQDCETKAFKRIVEKLLRWKKENEGFNRQKNWQTDITHACSWNEQALKNHYLMHQISDFMKQLYEHYVLKQLSIKKKQKIYLLTC